MKFPLIKKPLEAFKKKKFSCKELPIRIAKIINEAETNQEHYNERN